jgi:hypothetical protein
MDFTQGADMGALKVFLHREFRIFINPPDLKLVTNEVSKAKEPGIEAI